VTPAARRVALVTGGGRGIGRAIALALAREGCDVAVGGRTRAPLEETAATARGLGARALPVVLDVTDPASIAGAVAETVATLGPVDVLVNNAGVAESAPLAKTGLELWERHMSVNLPGMLERRWGRVINVASLAGLVGSPYVTAYTASKHALVGFTRALAMEIGGKGVTVNAICPGYVATDLVWKAARNIEAKTGTSFEEAVEALAKLNPGGRLLEPAEVAAVAARLLDADATNGETLVLDGTPTP